MDMSELAWFRCVRLFIAVFCGGLLQYSTLCVIFDPYDSGRFPTFMPAGISDESPRTANVSRGRDRVSTPPYLATRTRNCWPPGGCRSSRA